jgi:hypothetical protein
MRFAKSFCLPLVTIVCGMLASSVSAATITYVTHLDPANGSSTFPTATAYTSNLGYAFKTGPSGPFDIDWVKLGLTSGSSNASRSFKIAIHGTDNETPYSAVANATAYATDTVTVTLPGTINTPFEVTFTAADIPNITSFQLQSNTAYSMFVYNASADIALRRTQGYANGTTNGKYTVTSGFTMLDTFRNNSPNFAANSSSYPSFHISFGATASPPGAVPEPTTMAMWTLFVGGGVFRSYRNKKARK